MKFALTTIFCFIAALPSPAADKVSLRGRSLAASSIISSSSDERVLQIARGASCSANAVCADLKLSGSCCPTADGVFLECCLTPPLAEDALCSSNPMCQVLAGYCCPTNDFDYLECCTATTGSDLPSEMPSSSPLEDMPLYNPTAASTNQIQSDSPSDAPSKDPTAGPTYQIQSDSPSDAPSKEPTAAPTGKTQSDFPSYAPSKEPTLTDQSKSDFPSDTPSKEPTAAPTDQTQSDSPSDAPSKGLSFVLHPSNQ